MEPLILLGGLLAAVILALAVIGPWRGQEPPGALAELKLGRRHGALDRSVDANLVLHCPRNTADLASTATTNAPAIWPGLTSLHRSSLDRVVSQ